MKWQVIMKEKVNTTNSKCKPEVGWDSWKFKKSQTVQDEGNIVKL